MAACVFTVIHAASRIALSARPFEIDLMEQGAALVRQWLPGSGLEDIISAATIEAVKPVC